LVTLQYELPENQEPYQLQTNFHAGSEVLLQDIVFEISKFEFVSPDHLMTAKAGESAIFCMYGRVSQLQKKKMLLTPLVIIKFK
jgi:hypothetical protein